MSQDIRVKEKLILLQNVWMELENELDVYIYIYISPPIGATASIWALAYLHETLRFTSAFF
jgi:hypothetical protein